MTNSNTTKTTGGKKAAPERNSAATMENEKKTLPMNNIQQTAQNASPEDTVRRILAAAEIFLKNGYSVIPCYATEDKARGKVLGKKKGQPKVSAVPKWKPFTERAISPDEFRRYFSGRRFPADAIAVIGGPVSGNLVVLDFDNHNGAACVFNEWKSYVEETEAGKALFARLYVEQSQSGGVHVMARLEKAPGDLKEKVACTTDGTGVIEARWSGYTLCAPTPGYTLRQKRPYECPTITPDEWEILFAAAVRCDKRTVKALPGLLRRVEKEDRKEWAKTPGDAYNARENALDEMRDMILENGWAFAGDGKLEDGTPCEHYTRPGKDAGPSASLLIPLDGLPIFHVFTTNAPPLEPDDDYSPFALYAMLKHNGDFKAAAAALHAKGYGEKEAGKKTPGINELAAGFLAEWDAARTVNGGHCLKMYRGAFYEFRRYSGWREISGADLGGHIAEYLWKRKVDATAKRQSDIKAALAARHLCLLPSDTETPVRVSTGESLDPRKYIPVKNGIIRITDGAKALADLQLEPLTEDIFTPNALAAAFNPAAKCPLFLRYLKDVQPEKEEVESLQMMGGYMLTPDRALNTFFLLKGESNSGKSVFIEAMQGVLGPRNFSTLSYLQLIGKFETVRLVGPLANFASEMEMDFETAKRGGTPEEALKRITGGEVITVQLKYGQTYEAVPTALLVFATNNLPYIKDKTNAVYERLRIISFDQVISENKRDPQLKVKVKEERSGVLNWMLSGLLKIRGKNSFPKTKKGKDLSSELREENNPLLDAVASLLTPAPQPAAVNASEVYHRIQHQVEDDGHLKPGTAKIWREIQRQYPKATKGRERGRGPTLIYGVKMRE